MQMCGAIHRSIFLHWGVEVSGWIQLAGTQTPEIQLRSGSQTLPCTVEFGAHQPGSPAAPNPAEKREFRLRIQWAQLPAHLETPFSYHVLVANQTLLLAIAPNSQYALADFPLELGRFKKMVQNPASRYRDNATLKFLSECTLANPLADSNTRAAAICVVLYRFIEDFRPQTLQATEFSPWLTHQTIEVLQQPNVSLRWRISLLVAQAYGYLVLDQYDAAIATLQKLCGTDLAAGKTIDSSSNFAKGLALLGILLYKGGQADAALKVFEEVQTIIPKTAPYFKPNNIYKVMDLVVLATINQHCYEACMVIAPERYPHFRIQRQIGLISDKVVSVKPVREALKRRLGNTDIVLDIRPR